MTQVGQTKQQRDDVVFLVVEEDASSTSLVSSRERVCVHPNAQ
jgi:hypothetical protein